MVGRLGPALCRKAGRFVDDDGRPVAVNDHRLDIGGLVLRQRGPFLAWCRKRGGRAFRRRSEEHTSELQSLMRISYAVFCLNKNNNRIKELTNKQSASN